MKFGSIIQQATLRYTHIGTFPPTATVSVKCYRLNVKTVTPRIYVLYNLDIHHTFKHILVPHARFCWIPGPRRSFSRNILLEGEGMVPGGLPP